MNQEARDYIQIAIALIQKAEGLSFEAKADLVRNLRLAASQALKTKKEVTP